MHLCSSIGGGEEEGEYRIYEAEYESDKQTNRLRVGFFKPLTGLLNISLSIYSVAITFYHDLVWAKRFVNYFL